MADSRWRSLYQDPSGGWALVLFYKKYRRKGAKPEEKYDWVKSHDSCILGDKLEAAWKLETSRRPNPSLSAALWRTFRLELLEFAVLFIFVEFILKMSQPFLVGKLMDFYEDPSSNHTITVLSVTFRNESYIFSYLIVLTSFLNVLVAHFYYLGVLHLGMKARIACCSLIYRKSLRLSKAGLADVTVGRLINLQSNDVNRFDLAAMHFIQVCVAPVETIAVMVLSYVMLDWTAVAGIVFLLLFVPLQMYMGKLAGVYRSRIAPKTDQRIRLMTEILAGIQVIKMYAWEKPFGQWVAKARKLEIEQIRTASYLRALNVSFMVFMNRTGIFLCILLFVLTQGALDARYVFVVTTFYAILRQVLTVYLPLGLNNFGETRISIERIREFLLSEEENEGMKETVTYNAASEGKDGGLLAKDGDHVEAWVNEVFSEDLKGVSAEDVSVKLRKTDKLFVLDRINFSAISGELLAIIGSVGSGKTTLLSTILKELPVTHGHLQISGTVSYASQEPWLFSGTIQQNILFGLPFDKSKYKNVLEICGLTADLSSFPNGDQSIVGDRGMMLSGGQRSRINLSRAIYRDADIYLLDDPLSSVDTHVGKHIFTNCIKGYLKKKCVILVTHQVQYFGEADRIYLLERGRVAAVGSYNEISSIKKEVVEEAISSYHQDDVEAEEVDEGRSVEGGEKRVSAKATEQSKVGRVDRRVYVKYFNACGSLLVFSGLSVLFVLTQGAASGADFFSAYWTDLSRRNPGFTTTTCIYIYVSIIAFGIAVTITRSMLFFKFCMRASSRLHSRMLSKIIRAPLPFFYNNSAGSILNRFSKDIGSIDEVLPTVAMDTIGIAFGILGVVLLIAFVNPLLVIPTLVIFGLFYFFRTIFLNTSRNLKRNEAAARSPVLSHVTASLQGLATIRASGVGGILAKEFDYHQNSHSSAAYLFLSCNRAFGFWLDLSCVIYIAVVIVVVIISESYAGNIGLAITQAISLTGVVQYGIRQWSELENQMTSVERVVEYTELTPEPVLKPDLDSTTNIPEDWPNQGRIEFQNVFLKYSNSPTDPFILRDITLNFQPGEKVGVVGRTGAGKSSLTGILFRLVDFQGEVTIDGVDICSIPLKILRSKISIIPQEPVLFSGTLRSNLDPFESYDDERLWNALEAVKLKDLFSASPEGLNSELSERGANLSVGQKQLVCLARAILRENRILVLDEATANVDPQTDELIQRTIRDKCEDCTVITVAHRLNTVMDSHRILVMDGGAVVEFDSPYKLLLAEGESMLWRLAKDMGKETEDTLVRIAKEAFEKNVRS